MPLRLGTPNQQIHLLRALFQSLSNFKEIFFLLNDSFFFHYSYSCLLHICLASSWGRRMKGGGAIFHSHNIAIQVPSCTSYSGCVDLFVVFSVPSSLLLRGADPSAGAAFPSFLDTIPLSSDGTHSVELSFLITLHFHPSPLLALPATCTTPYESTFHTQFIYTSALPLN